MTFYRQSLFLKRAAMAAALMAAWLVAPGFASANAGHIYLNWQSKSAAAPAKTKASAPVDDAIATATGPAYPVPPSPYGQVGDPYRQHLNWPSKPIATAAPTPARASVQVATVAAPVLTPPPVAVAAPMPLPAPKPPTVSESQVRAAVPAPTPAPAQASADDGYQVPATSKYAATIKAARAAQAKTQAQAQAASAKDAKPQASTVTATASAPDTTAPLADTETDHVFVPGEHYTDASDGPRFYSLHREYGLKPDPITVDTSTGGALLDTTHLDAQEAAKIAKQAKDEVGDTSADTDTAKTSASSVTDQKAKP